MRLRRSAITLGLTPESIIAMLTSSYGPICVVLSQISRSRTASSDAHGLDTLLAAWQKAGPLYR